MKTFILLFVAFFFSMGLWAQKAIDTKKVPSATQKAFKRKNSRSTDVKWFEDRDNRLYHVKFKENGSPAEVIITYDNKIIEKKTDVAYKMLPSKIRENLKKDYKKLKFHKATLIVKGRKDKYYSIIMHESQGRKKAPKVWEIQYTLQGKLLTVYEPEEEIVEEEYQADRYEETLDAEATELQGKVRDEKVSKKELPTGITSYMEKHYDYEYRYKEILLKTNAKYGQYYYIVMKKQGEKVKYVHYFDTMGKLIKVEEVGL